MSRPPTDTGTIALPILRSMAAGDLDAAHALSVAVGWPHRPADWRLAHGLGRGVVAADEGGRIMGSALWWDWSPTLATIGMVIVSPRLQGQGTGRRLMRHLSAEIDARTVGLVATPAGHRLYEAEGFSGVGRIAQHQGLVYPVVEETDPRIRPAQQADAGVITELDRRASGADRSALLQALSSVGQVHVFVDGKPIAGYAICRPFGRGHVIGPVVADRAETAIALARSHLAAHPGRFVRVDTNEADSSFARFLAASGLPAVDHGIQMFRGPAPQTGPARLFALAAQALG